MVDNDLVKLHKAQQRLALSLTFLQGWAAMNTEFADPEPEYQFALPERQWAFDFAWAAPKVAVEIEGGIYGKSRHTSGKGYEEDCRKYNTATLKGWALLRLGTKMVTHELPVHLEQLLQLLRDRSW